jgi:excisionase family DNA binding protein
MVDGTPAPGYVTVAEAAKRLSVTEQRVLRLIHQHELEADRVGHAYLVRLEDVERRAALAPAGGRRFTTTNAWGLLELAARNPAPWLDRSTRYRLRRLLAERGLAALRSRLTGRGVPSRFRAHPSQLRGLRSDPALMLSGATAAAELQLGLLAGEVVEGYVDARELDGMVRRHHLRTSREPNVILRVVPTFAEAWPPAKDAPLSAIALDLLDDPDPRARTLGAQLLARIGR